MSTLTFFLEVILRITPSLAMQTFTINSFRVMRSDVIRVITVHGVMTSDSAQKRSDEKLNNFVVASLVVTLEPVGLINVAPGKPEAFKGAESGDDANSCQSPTMGVKGDLYQSPPIGIGGDSRRISVY
ncbi:hypothetical protein CCR75_002582 [Bremia lactucae]|uniref:Uncharacterized protein n=1 Tax=Bremia lactucae TaxID=4779 RepID=A0A976FLY9_BRELC|nr:hypothetical protein CCR75_002582 [Bremia lactucae]